MVRFDEYYKEITTILENDYALHQKREKYFAPKHYLYAVAKAYKEQTLNDYLFYEYMTQYLADIRDHNLHFQYLEQEDYVPGTIGFETRHINDVLYVTKVNEETRLHVGDKILALNGAPISYHRKHIQRNIFFSDKEDQERFEILINMCRDMVVEHTDGTQEKLTVMKYPFNEEPMKENTLTSKDNTEILTVYTLDESISPLLTKLNKSNTLILDLRQCTDGNEEGMKLLLPYLLKEPVSFAKLMENETYIRNYTERNSKVSKTMFEALASQEELSDEDKAFFTNILSEINENYGKGEVKEQRQDSTEDLAALSYFDSVIILQDRDTANSAETLISITRSLPYVTTMGRETSGSYLTKDVCAIRFSDLFVLYYPMSYKANIKEDEFYITPDHRIDFTEEECMQDCILDAALKG